MGIELGYSVYPLHLDRAWEASVVRTVHTLSAVEAEVGAFGQMARQFPDHIPKAIGARKEAMVVERLALVLDRLFGGERRRWTGKPLGVVSFIYLATRLRLAVRPPSLTWPLLVGGGLLTGIGFTMALLIAELALEPNRVDSAKFGILCASVLSAASGLALLTWLTRTQSRH